MININTLDSADDIVITPISLMDIITGHFSSCSLYVELLKNLHLDNSAQCYKYKMTAFKTMGEVNFG